MFRHKQSYMIFSFKNGVNGSQESVIYNVWLVCHTKNALANCIQAELLTYCHCSYSDKIGKNEWLAHLIKKMGRVIRWFVFHTISDPQVCKKLWSIYLPKAGKLQSWAQLLKFGVKLLWNYLVKRISLMTHGGTKFSNALTSCRWVRSSDNVTKPSSTLPRQDELITWNYLTRTAILKVKEIVE